MRRLLLEILDAIIIGIIVAAAWSEWLDRHRERLQHG